MKSNEYSLNEFLTLLKDGKFNVKNIIKKSEVVAQTPTYDNKKFLAELNKNFNPYSEFSTIQKKLGKK